MNVFQIVMKTVITTLDLIFIFAAFKFEEGQSVNKFGIIFLLMNVAGVWI